jgi:hypothetical protein
MPVSYAVDNDLEIVVVRLSGRIAKYEVMEAAAEMSRAMSPDRAYRSLLVFESTADLSEMDAGALVEIHAASKATARQRQQRPRARAAVADPAHDARLILPLWNALCETDPEPDLRYTLFEAAEAALAWLGIPEAEGLAAIAGTEQTSR